MSVLLIKYLIQPNTSFTINEQRDPTNCITRTQTGEDSRARVLELGDLVPPPGELDVTYCIVFYQGPFALLCENMTSSIKSEVRNLLHCRQKRTGLRSPVTCTKNLVKFGHVVLEICEHADRQTEKQTNRHSRHADRNTSPTYRGEVTILLFYLFY